jgi:hypothetical protein
VKIGIRRAKHRLPVGQVQRSFELYWHADTIAAIAAPSNGHIPARYNPPACALLACVGNVRGRVRGATRSRTTASRTQARWRMRSLTPPPGTPLPMPDLSDMDRVHRAIATNSLAETFTRLALFGATRQ